MVKKHLYEINFQEKTKFPIWVINFAGLTSLLCALKFQDWHFVIIAFFCSFMSFLASNKPVSKHLLMSLCLLILFATLHTKSYLEQQSFIMIIINGAYIIGAIFKRIFVLLQKRTKP